MPYFSRDPDTDILTITTAIITVKFQQGAVIYIKDASTNEEFIPTGTVWNTHFPADKAYYIGGVAIDLVANNGLVFKWSPSGDYVHAVGTLVSASHYKVEYTYCLDRFDSETADANLTYDFEIDTATEEVLISISGSIPASWKADPLFVYPYQVNLPLVNFGGEDSDISLIFKAQTLGFTDTTAVINNIGYANDRGNPPVLVGQGASSCFGVWSEVVELVPETIKVDHHYDGVGNNYNNIILNTAFDPKLQCGGSPGDLTIVGGPWRFTIQSNWLDVAKRWRARFNILNPDAKYLWEKTPAWVRDIHCRTAPNNINNPTNWDNLAAQTTIPISKMLVDSYALDWQTDGECLYGMINPRLTDTTGNGMAWPKDNEIVELKAHNFKVVNYIYYNAVLGATAMSNRLTAMAAYLPTGWSYPYDFVQSIKDYWVDYDAGKTDDENVTAWLAYWQAVAAMTGSDYWKIHPGSTEYVESWLPFMSQLMDYFGYSGLFWDVSWMDLDNYSGFNGFVKNAPTIRIQNSKSFADGMKDAGATISANYAIYSEYLSYRLMPYTFSTWDGPRMWKLDTPMTHPLRAALTGSYIWVMDDRLTSTPPVNIDDYNHEWFAYLGCIPQYMVDTEYMVPTFGNEYYTARAKMFCDYDMYYDLPDTWGDVTEELAYYKTNTTVKFKLVKRATGRYAYVNADNDAYILQHELKTGESTGAKTFADTYTSTPTVVVSADCSADNITLTGFDFTGSGDWLVFGEQGLSNYSRGDYGSLPTDDADLETYYSASDETAVATDDSSRVAQSAPEEYTIHQFKKKITANKAKVKVNVRTTIPCTNSTVYLQIYNRSGTPTWETIDSDNTTGANTDFDMESVELTLTNYKNEDDFIAVRVQQLVQ